MSALPSRRRPIRSIRCFVLLAASLLAWGVAADEFVAIGRVEQVTLLPEGTARCPAACQDDASGKTVCVSNTCGCGEALIRIDRVLVVATKVDHVTTSQYLNLRNLLGQRYLYLYPGDASTTLQPGAELTFDYATIEAHGICDGSSRAVVRNSSAGMKT